MRKLIFSFLTTLVFFAFTGANSMAQSSSPPCCNKSPHTSKLWLGLSSDVSNQPISEIAMLPTLLYFPIRNVGVGGNGLYWDDGQTTYKGLELKVRVYATTNTFVSGGIFTDFDTNGYSVEAGYTAFLGSRFYVEPSARFVTIHDTHRVSLAVGVGIRL